MNKHIQIDLSNKVALITGATRGLGVFYAETLAKNGATVILLGRKNSKDKLDQQVEMINKKYLGNKASSFIIDMADYDKFSVVVKEIVKSHKKIDILINNAAISNDASFFDITPANWDLHFDTNLKGLFFLSQAVAMQMKTQECYSSIINIAAINGQQVRKNCLPFAVSKAGVLHLTKVMAKELIDYKIKVNAISLGLFASESVNDYLENDPTAEDYLSRIPAKRAGEYADLEGPILLLASDASNYMFGSVINVDGGFSANVFMDLDIKN